MNCETPLYHWRPAPVHQSPGLFSSLHLVSDAQRQCRGIPTIGTRGCHNSHALSNQSRGLTLSSQSILVIGTESWFGPLLSKQHVVLELCKRNKVLYMEPFYHLGSLLRGHLPHRLSHEPYHDEQPPTLHRLTPLRLPKSQALPWVRRLSETIVLAQLRFRRFRPDVVLSFNPYFAFLAGRWEAPFVYYCVDTQPDEAAEAETLTRADLVVAATEVLYQRFKGRTRRLKYLPHGVNIDALNANAGDLPPEMVALPHPVAGFVGAIGPFLDTTLIEQLAQARPDLSLVLVGPYEKGSFGGGLAHEALARLRGLPNIHLLGPRPSEQLGAYINAFDVGIIPYHTSHPRVHFSYHKVLQYLALGKPVVTTCFASNAILPPHVTVAESHAAFVEAVGRALTCHDVSAAHECRAFARQHTWERRVAQLSDWIAECIRLSGNAAS